MRKQISLADLCPGEWEKGARKGKGCSAVVDKQKNKKMFYPHECGEKT